MPNRLFLVANVLEVWTSEARKFRLRETGGMLIGYHTRSGQVVVTHATGPGPKARHGFRSFTADYEYCQEKLDKLFYATGGALTFIGDWHTHPIGRPEPSRRDIATTISVATDPDYRCPKPIVAIYNPGLAIAPTILDQNVRLWLIDTDDLQVVQLSPTVVDGIPGYDLPEMP